MAKPVPIVKISEDPEESGGHTFYLDEDALNGILSEPSVKDKPLCIVSVAGAFRRGKSFLLDFLLRYLNHYDSRANGEGIDEGDNNRAWLGDQDDPLGGFHWRGGAERDTTGILMWSKVFVIKVPPKRKEVAIVLMDTQGAFDSSSTVRDCATIFALSAMLSSVLVYNLTSNIQEDDLQHLELFTEYGRLALEDSGEKPFQKLQFLVRDWCYPYETEYGAKGGRQIVERRLEVNSKQHNELQDLRKHIRSCFSHIEGFLMPHPGLNVATNPKFDGRLSDIDSTFIHNLAQFVPLLLAPENVIIKKISGNEVKCKELLGFFKAYIEIFKGDEMPEPKNMLQATSEANNLASLAEAKDAYMSMMEAVCGGEKPYINEHVLDIEHCRIKDNALQVFSSRRKMGGEEFSRGYQERLEKEIEDSYANFRAHNEGKNIFKAANTPITFAAVAMLIYVIGQIFALVGLYPLANLLNLFMTITFLLLTVWSYTKYTGKGSDVGENIDKIASTIWENGLQPLFNKMAEEGTAYAARKAVQRINSTENKKRN